MAEQHADTAPVESADEAATLSAECKHYLRACGHYCHHTFCCYCRLVGPPLAHGPCLQCARIDGEACDG